MRIEEVQPGLFREILSDDERREHFSLSQETVDALRGKPGSRSIYDAISNSFSEVLRKHDERRDVAE